MPEKETRAKSRRERIEVARSRDILDVASELNMELVQSGRDYRWKEHDSLVISPDNNLWKWFSRNLGGDVISLVETIKETDFNQSVIFLNDGEFKTFQKVERSEEPFNYYLKPYEQPFNEARTYLREERGLSDDTIEFFLEKGVLAQANAKVHGSIEPVIVFKSLTQGEIIGAQLQGIEANWKKWPERGYAKKIVNNSDGMTGLHVDIGQPKRLIFTESSIDLMSYYELHKDSLQDVRLVSMDGLKEATIGRHLAELQAERSGRDLRWSKEELANGLATAVDNNYFRDGKHADVITLAVDNDEAGRNFITSLQEKGVSLTVDIPELPEGQEKEDWNSYLQVRHMEQEPTPEAEIITSERLSLSDIQENLSTEADLVSTVSNDGSVIYTNTVSFNQGYNINLEIHSPNEVDNLSDVKAPWMLEVTKNSQSLGYLAYGEDWGNDFNIEDELVNLDSWVTRNQVENHLYSQEEVNSFLKSLTAEKEAVGELKSYGTFIIDDDFLERRYGSVEHDNSIRTAIEQLSNLIGFNNMPINDQETEWVHTKEVDFEGTQLILDVYSSSEDKIFEGKNQKNNWSIAVLGENGPLGFLTYGEAWLDDINVGTTLRDKLTDLQTWITEGSISKHLYTQQDYNQFNASLKEKAPEKLQETVTSNSEQNKKERTYSRMGSLQPKAEGSPTPEVAKATSFERSVTSRPTISSRYLHFSITDGLKSRKTGLEHSINQSDLNKLNRRGREIQEAAQFYQDELANATISYFTSDGSVAQVNFLEKNFMHLTGLKPLGEGKTPEQILRDFASGGELVYDDILIGNNDSAFDKIKVLPDLIATLEINSFYFDSLQGIDRYNGRFDSLIKADDKDIMLLFRVDTEDGTVPVSIFKARQTLMNELQEARKNEIIGIYRERDGQIEQIAINDEYIKDNGEEMLSILQNKQYQELSNEQFEMPEPSQPEVTAEDFTHVLDAVYNNGAQIGKDNRDNIPVALHPAWDKYNEYAAQHDNDFNQIIDAAERDHLLNKDSDFYKAWSQDDIYDNHYHVRLQELSTETSLPFQATDLIDYQDFARELYHQNQRSQLGDEVTSATVNFAIYAPGGDLVKEGVSYHIGEESKPISQLLGLGYRRLTGYQDLAQMDNNILSQLENQTLNQTIVEDIAESVPTSRETRQEVTASHNEAKTITSEREVLKNRFQRRVEEILNESPVQNQVNHRTGDIIINNSTVASNNSMIINSGIISNRQTNTSTIHKTPSSPSPKKSSEPVDYQKVSAYELSQAAFQKIRDYTQSPKDLAEYLDFMSKFPTLSPRNVALIQAQWPGANAVATYNQWQAMADSLGLSKDDVMQTKATYTNKRTGQTKEVVHNSLSVKAGEKSRIRLFRPQMEKMIPVLDNNGNQLKNEKGNPKFKRLSQATPQEKALVKEKKLKVSLFQRRDANGQPLYTTYNVFELSQTTLKPESYPKAMPNRHYNFDTDQVKTNEVLEGLCDYAKSIGVSILSDDAHTLGNIKGAFDPNRQEILLNPHNTPGEKIGTTIHELAHATLHNPKKMMSQTKTVPRYQAELEAEMTSYLVSKHFGLDTGDKAFRYMANWTDNLTIFSDKALTDSMTRIHKTVMSMVKHVEHHTKPYQRNHGQQPNFPKAQDKGLKR
ncbi:PBECR4 domain-containing protein [Streptococcus gallolyticus]|uniref:PBECR4 domain-containing protein n=1 Tax=Streptococcus gallolyticus TaxID=315405 RepID=UPI0022B69B23|nr:PBECR4 domain-containing protein [Streptococcus gallolyticus]WAW97899.1 PBECR4 domain-containing protein [Streptococcus gallolyticus]WAW98943.1 PBECR4 domain-containing protein [Streptococcus gallolyticus]